MVSFGQCPGREPLADVKLVAWVDVVRFANIDDDRHACLRRSQRHHLCFAQLGPIAVSRLRLGRPPTSELNEIERKLTLVPRRPPITDHRREEGPILISAIGIALALVPDRAANRIRLERRDHRIVENAGTVLICWSSKLWT